MTTVSKVKAYEGCWQIWVNDVNGEELLHTFTTEEQADHYLKTGERMKKFSVLITTSFDGYVDIEAGTAEEAMEKAREMVENGEFNALDFEPFTEIPFAEEIK
jgi:hypothetical protein